MTIDSGAVFNYGINPDQDIQNDLLIGLKQDKRTLFFDRSDTAGVSQLNNAPNTYSLQLLAKYYIASWIAYRNSYVSQSNPDMRISTSQSVIDISQTEDYAEIQIQYIKYSDKSSINNFEVGLS